MAWSVSAAHHNGKRGSVQIFNVKKGRYDVETEEGGTVATKPSNLRRTTQVEDGMEEQAAPLHRTQYFIVGQVSPSNYMYGAVAIADIPKDTIVLVEPAALPVEAA